MVTVSDVPAFTWLAVFIPKSGTSSIDLMNVINIKCSNNVIGWKLDGIFACDQ